MTISYKWLCEYLPAAVGGQKIQSPEKMAEILTSIGLEVESMSRYELIPGSMQGLVVGEVLTCEQHPDADKLKVTTVNTGNEQLQIVCGASNVAAGQKVIVAPVGSTIHPINGEPIVMKKARIRGIESQGMICAEDEIGIGTDHEGIIVLSENVMPGTPAAAIFEPYDDHIIEIGITPNRIDAMSHIGVAKDVCAYLSHHQNEIAEAVLPYAKTFPAKNESNVEVIIESEACKRYSGITISNIKVAPSPAWLKNKLTAIGVNPINNIVDITNFILHETGQPLHAFDLTKVNGGKIIVKKATEGSSFITLDNKERKLTANDLMICNATTPMCIAGIYGGAESGVTNDTTSIFLESAFFDAATIRRSSLNHGLRTDAAIRFEKITDISNTVNVLKRAALLISEIAGGEISGSIIDIYPAPEDKKQITLSYSYINKLSGKEYTPEVVKNILLRLGFTVIRDEESTLTVDVPYHKTDISIPADIVEEVLRIDGLDNITIPQTIAISPAPDKDHHRFALRKKIADQLCAKGFYEIFTNSISNSAWYKNDPGEVVKMINSLSAELDIMRPDMMQSGLQSIAYNLNRKNNDILFFEFGKTYKRDGESFKETPHLVLYMSGSAANADWKNKDVKADFYHLKGLVQHILLTAGISCTFEQQKINDLKYGVAVIVNTKTIGYIGEVAQSALKIQDIKQPVFYADLLWDAILKASGRKTELFREIPKFPGASRDLAIVVDKSVTFESVEKATADAKVRNLVNVHLFDIFESDKLGANKKSLALNYTFSDDSKTLTDKDIDAGMNKLIMTYEKQLQAEIRK